MLSFGVSKEIRMFCENLNDCIFSQKDTLTNMIGNLIFDLTALLFDVYFQTRKTQELIKFAEDQCTSKVKASVPNQQKQQKNGNFKF